MGVAHLEVLQVKIIVQASRRLNVLFAEPEVPMQGDRSCK